MDKDPSQAKRVLRASAALFGTIIGAGIFGLPALVQASGWLIGIFWMLVLAAAVTLTHALFGEVVLATPGEHRLIGYVGIWLGPWARRVETVTSVLTLYGASLAYLILGGLFLSQVVSFFTPFPPFAASLVIFVFVAVAVGRGRKFLTGVDFWISAALVLTFLLLLGRSLPGIRLENLLQARWENVFLPYGVVLFAYGGLVGVTEVRDMLKGRPDLLRKSIVFGTLAAVALTIAFTTAVVGATGSLTTSEALSGLNKKFGGVVPFIGGIAGFLAITSSYLMHSLYLRGQYRYDFKWKDLWAWAAAVGVPFLLFLAGVRSFGRVLELVGATLVGVEGMFVCLMYLKARKRQKTMRIPPWIVRLLIAVYAAGALYELVFRLLIR